MRVSIAAADIARVAELAQVGIATVRRYRRMSGDGVTPRHQLRRAQEAAIARAAAEVERETRQLQLLIPFLSAAGTEAGHQPPGDDDDIHDVLCDCPPCCAAYIAAHSPVASIAAPPPSETRTPGGGIGCLTALAESVSLTKRPDRQVAHKRLTILLDGRAMTVDELAEYTQSVWT